MTAMKPNRHHMQGFTAVELMIVVVIVGILTALAAPAMTQMVRNQRVKTAAFDLNASLVFARSEALKRNVAVTITPNDAGNWTKGWRITDANNNLLKQEADRNLLADELSFTGPASVVFARNGRLNAAVAGFNIDDPGKTYTTAAAYAKRGRRCVGLDLRGRVTTQSGGEGTWP